MKRYKRAGCIIYNKKKKKKKINVKEFIPCFGKKRKKMKRNERAGYIISKKKKKSNFKVLTMF